MALRECLVDELDVRHRTGDHLDLRGLDVVRLNRLEGADSLVGATITDQQARCEQHQGGGRQLEAQAGQQGGLARLAHAIAVAGGFSPRANQGDVDVTRKINGKIITGRVSISEPILAGDTIYVRERLF